MPLSPPPRTTDQHYHFHTYDFQGSAAFTLGPAQPDRGKLQFYSLVQDLDGLLLEGQRRQVPNISLTDAGVAITAGGANRRTKVLSLGPAANAANVPAVVITGGIHAREWVSPEMTYLLAEYLVINYNSGARQNLNQYEQTIRDLVDERQIHIIPMLNPDGNCYTVFSPDENARSWRKNRRALPTTPQDWLTALTQPGQGQNREPNPPFRNVVWPQPQKPWTTVQYDVPSYDPPPAFESGRMDTDETGVDLNRNFATTAWGYDCKSEDGGTRVNYDPKADSYFGPAAGSEVETRNIQAFLVTTPQLAAAIDYHSYAQCILYPTEAYDRRAVGADYERLGKALRALVRSQAARDYQLGSPKQLIGYDAPGTVVDYIAQHNQARAFTIELDPPLRQQPGFQLPETEIRTVFEKNIRGALAAIAAPRLASTKWFSAKNRSTSIAETQRQLLGWDVYGRGNRLPA